MYVCEQLFHLMKVINNNVRYVPIIEEKVSILKSIPGIPTK